MSTYDESFWSARAEARTTVATLRRLSKAAARFVRAADRHPHSDHLVPMLHSVGVQAQLAFQRGATLEDVAGACGLLDPPAIRGLDDMPVPPMDDVEAALVHRLHRTTS